MFDRLRLAAGVNAGMGSTYHELCWTHMGSFHPHPDARSLQLRGPVRCVESVSETISPRTTRPSRNADESRDYYRVTFDAKGRCTLEERAEGKRPNSLGRRLGRSLGMSRIPVDFEQDDYSFTFTHRVEREFDDDALSSERVWRRIIDSGRVRSIQEELWQFQYHSGRLVAIDEASSDSNPRFQYHFDGKGRVSDIVPSSFVVDRHVSFEYEYGRCVRVLRKERSGEIVSTEEFHYEGDRIVRHTNSSYVHEPPDSYMERLFDQFGFVSEESHRDRGGSPRRRKILDYARDPHGNWIIQQSGDGSVRRDPEGRHVDWYSFESRRRIHYD